MHDGFSERLHLALDDLNWKKRGRPAKLVGLLQDKISEPAVRKWLTGSGHPSMPHLKELALLTGRRIEWFLMGDADNGSTNPISTTSLTKIAYMVPVIRNHFILDFLNGAPLDESVIQ